jgi:hypothetical protein
LGSYSLHLRGLRAEILNRVRLMLNLVLTTDKLQLVTSTTANVDVHASFADLSGTTVTPGKQNTAIATAATTDIVAVPGASTVRNVKTLHIRNKHTTLSDDVTLLYNANGTTYELYKCTLLTGEELEYVEGVGFFIAESSRLDRWLSMTADAVNATTSFADVTGLTCPVESGRTYNFLTHLTHAENTTTTGPRFGINGPSLSGILISIIDVVAIGVDTTTLRSGPATAVDTSAAGASATGTTGNKLGIMSGVFTTGASGTFAIRFQSEVAVAAGVTVRAGSWCHVWEATEGNKSCPQE